MSVQDMTENNPISQQELDLLHLGAIHYHALNSKPHPYPHGKYTS